MYTRSKNFISISRLIATPLHNHPTLKPFCFTKFSLQQSFSNFSSSPNSSQTPGVSTMATQADYEQMGCADVLEAKPFSLPPLPYAPSALEPYIGTTTMKTHYGKHHVAYVKKLNELVKGTEFESMSLEEVVKNATGGMFNQAAQAWNHNFFWKCMTPNKQTPSGPAFDAMTATFGSYENFKAKFVATATGQFGSGWAWVTKTPSGEIVCESTPNGVNPVSTGSGKPIMGIDVWEHAYYLDYKQDRAGYVNNWFNTVNWEFVNENYNSA